MLSFKTETRYHKDRAVAVGMLLSSSPVDTDRVKEQLIQLDRVHGESTLEWNAFAERFRKQA